MLSDSFRRMTDVRPSSSVLCHSQDLLRPHQQRPALFKALLVERAKGQIDFLSAAAEQALRQPAQRELARGLFVFVRPRATDGPVAREDVGMRERLIQSFPPTRAARVDPELHVHRLIVQQKSIGWRKKHGFFFFLHVLQSCYDAAVHHLDIYFRAFGLYVFVFANHLAEFARRGDQPGGYAARVEIVMKSKARL